MIQFPKSAITRDLLPEEIERRSLPRRWWAEFEQDLNIRSGIAGDFTVPAGFLTDGASVPRICWALLSDSDPDILYPSFAHDWLYSCNGHLANGKRLDKAQCDHVIYELMLACGAPRWKAGAVFYALAIGGQAAWDSALNQLKISKANI